MSTNRGRPPLKTLRWSLRLAAVEFGMSQATVKRRLAIVNEVPGTDGQYATNQLLKALYGDLSAEKLRKLRADRELTEAKLAVINRDYLPRDGVINALTNSLLFIRRAIEGCTMTGTEKRRLLKYLASPAVANLFDTDREAQNGENG